MERKRIVVGVSCLVLMFACVAGMLWFTSPRVDTVPGGEPPSAQDWLTQERDFDKLPPAPHYVFSVDFTQEESDPTVYITGQGNCISELNPEGLHFREEAQITVKSRKSRFAVNGRSEFTVRKHAVLTMGDGSSIEIKGSCRVTLSGSGKLVLDGSDECSVSVKGPLAVVCQGIKLDASACKKVQAESGYATLNGCSDVEISSKGVAYCKNCKNVQVKDQGRATVIDAQSLSCFDRSVVQVYGKNTSISLRGECKVSQHK